MTECPCCRHATSGDAHTCEMCGIGLPADWEEASERHPSTGDRVPHDYDPYEQGSGVGISPGTPGMFPYHPVFNKGGYVEVEDDNDEESE